MNRIISLIALLAICISLCACGTSVETQKADELILAIGEVSLEKEPAILAAKAYFDTLTDNQKKQVENAELLQSAIEKLDTIKKESEYIEIYEKALEYEKNLQIDVASAEYEKLPSDYEDVAQRMSDISPLVGVVGTWTCDSHTAVSNKGTELGVMFETISISIESYKDGNAGLSYSGDWANMKYTNSSIVAGHVDLLFMLEDIGTWGGLQQAEDGCWILGETSCGRTGFGTLTITYSITAEGKLNVEYSLKNNGNVTTVEFTYSKQQ